MRSATSKVKTNNTPELNTSRDGFVFYRSFMEAIVQLSKRQQLKVFEAIVNYGLYRTEPVIEGKGKIVWILAKPQLDANWQRFEAGCRVGALRRNQSARKNNQKQPNVNDNVNDNEKENVNVNPNEFLDTTTTTHLCL